MDTGNRHMLAKFFMALGRSLDSIDDATFSLVLEGKADFEVRITEIKDDARRDSDSISTSTNKTVPCFPAQDVAKRLCAAESRDEVDEVIAAISRPRKPKLVQVAQLLNISIESKDTIDKIERKLIEFTIGAKLSSRSFAEVKMSSGLAGDRLVSPPHTSPTNRLVEADAIAHPPPRTAPSRKRSVPTTKGVGKTTAGDRSLSPTVAKMKGIRAPS